MLFTINRYTPMCSLKSVRFLSCLKPFRFLCYVSIDSVLLSKYQICLLKFEACFLFGCSLRTDFGSQVVLAAFFSACLWSVPSVSSMGVMLQAPRSCYFMVDKCSDSTSAIQMMQYLTPSLKCFISLLWWNCPELNPISASEKFFMQKSFLDCFL